MNVSVDEARQHPFAPCIEALGIRRDCDGPSRACGDNPVAVDDYGRVGHRRRAGAVDEGAADQGERSREAGGDPQ